ncbi:MAG: DMT family transporter [Hyphomicrobiales bacterium]
MALIDWMRLLLLASVWGTSFMFIEVSLRGFGPFTIVFVRILLGVFALLIYCAVRGIRIDTSRSALRAYAVMGLLANVIPFSLLTIGQTQVDSGLSSIFIAATPLLTVIVAHLWGRTEVATPARICGTAIGLAGVALLMGTNVLRSNEQQFLGEVALLCAALFYALSAVYGRRLPRQAPAANATAMLLAATPICAIVAFALEQPLASLPPIAPVAALLALGFLSTGFAYVIYLTILANAGSTYAMLVTLVQPPIAILLGTMLLGEKLDSSQFAGFGLIAVGLLLVDGRVLKPFSSRKTP